MYRTLPAGLRRQGDGRNRPDGGEAAAGGVSEAGASPGRGARRHKGGGGGPGGSDQNLFGLHLNLGLSSIISGGMNLLGQFRRRTPSSSSASTPVNSTSSPRSEAAARLGSGASGTGGKTYTVARGDSIASTTVGGGYAASRSSSLSSSAGAGDVFYEAREVIELSSFPVIAEAAGEGQTGRGHVFEAAGSFNPTWCDLCGDLIWGLYDTGASRCVHCNYTCHVRCQRRVRLNCSILLSDESEEGGGGDREEEEDVADGTRSKQVALEAQDSEYEDLKSVEASTLANISTLRSEEVFISAASGSLSKVASSKRDVGVEKEEEEEKDSDSDDAYMTLKDVDHIQMDHDDEVGASNASAAAQLPLNSPELFGEGLSKILEEYNSIGPPGQETVQVDGDSGFCRGFIRVEMNLSRPINVATGSRPPSVYHITKDGGGADTAGSCADGDRTLTTFYLPHSTVKALHVTSETTTRDVVQSLLGKFRVADNPHKYALYEKALKGSCDFEEGGGGAANGEGSVSTVPGSGVRRMSTATLSRIRMRKMRKDERPLVLALLWCREGWSGERCFVLQENDPGEVSWESFSLPELKNFLLILDREEAWYKKRIHERYDLILEHMQLLAEEKRAEADAAAAAEVEQAVVP